MSSLELISTERALLTLATDSFGQKQTDVTDKYQAIVDRLATNMATENEETAALAQLQSQLGELSLGATLDKFKDMKSDLDAKFQTYTALVQSNNSLAAAIFESSKGTKDIVSEILSVISELDANIANINTTIDTYSTVSSVVSSSSPSAAPAAPAAPAEESEGPVTPVTDA